MCKSIISLIDLPQPNQQTIDYFLNQVNIVPRESFGFSHIAAEIHRWADNFSLIEKSIFSKIHINSGFLEDHQIYKLLKDQYCVNGKDQDLFNQYLPNHKENIWVFAQHNQKYSDGKFVGISSAPHNWSLYPRGINLIYTLPGNSWTFKYYTPTEFEKTKQLSVHSYNELTLIDEIKIEENTWYCIDFTQPFFTEEIWGKQLNRFMLVLR